MSTSALGSQFPPPGRRGPVSDVDHAVLKKTWDKAFTDLKAAGVEHDADHPVAKAYRDASDAVNHANRSRDYGIATGSLGKEVFPRMKTKADLNGHLINDHEYTEGGAGNSTRNMPSKAELHEQHEWVHKHGISEKHDHTHE